MRSTLVFPLFVCGLAWCLPVRAELRTLPPGDVTPEQQRLLDEIVSSPDYFTPAMRLKTQANQGVLRKLEELAVSKEKELRTRAAYAMVVIASRETLAAAVRVALTDKETAVRESVAMGLLSPDVSKVMAEAGLLDECRKGLGDKKLEVQLAFAVILQVNGDKSGISVLEKGLKHRDHHWQETSAEALAALDDDSGAPILIKMLSYDDKSHPLLKANRELRTDREAWTRLLETVNDERVRVCGLLGKLSYQKAIPVLEKLSRSSPSRVAEAAKEAIARIRPTQESGIPNREAGGDISSPIRAATPRSQGGDSSTHSS